MRRGWIVLCLAFVAATKSPQWPRLYNEGVTAYRSNEFAAAATAFEQVTASTDRALQQRALYNLGNACYRLGEAQPPQTQQFWQRALKSYESALALDPNDADAKFNRDFVKKKLDELKKQQEQQQQQQDKQQNQQKQHEDQKKTDQNQQQQSDKEQSEQQQEQQAKPQQPAEASQQPAEQKRQAQPGQTNNFDRVQAAVLLDNLREDERNWNFYPELQMDLKDSTEPAKDW